MEAILNKTKITQQTKFNSFISYLIVILVLIYETSPFIFAIRNTYWIILVTFLFLYAITNNYRILNIKIVVIVLTVWGLVLLQYFLFGGGISHSFLTVPLKNFYTPFLVFSILGLRYYKLLLRVIYFIAIYTSVIYLLQSFIPSFNNSLMHLFEYAYQYSWADWPRTILIYNIPRDSGFFLMRNSGAFHEPGAYSVYLMLGIILNTYFTKKILHSKNIFFTLVLLTTFSTTGYIMLLLFSSYAILKLKINNLLKPLIITPFLFFIIYIYKEATFLESKIEEHYESQIESIQLKETDKRGRIYSFGMSFKAFATAPITGRGIQKEQKYDIGEIGSFGYGFGGLFALYGMFFGLFYMWFFYKGFIIMQNIFSGSKRFSQLVFIIINIGLLTQNFFFYTSFSYFFLIGLYYKHYSLKRLNMEKVQIN